MDFFVAKDVLTSLCDIYKMTEKEFLELIDCNFPYGDRQRCVELIDRSLSISPNAVFAVVEEICRIPGSERQNVSETFLLELLNGIDNKFEHPIKGLVFEVARVLIKRGKISVDDAVLKMEEIVKYQDAFSARSIVYFSCDDTEGKLEKYFK